MVENAITADVLFQACAAGNFEKLQQLLADPACIAKAIETEDRILDPDIGHYRRILNLSLMCSKAAAAGSADIIEYLLSFSRNHGIAPEVLVDRDTVNAAIVSDNSVAIFKELVDVKPDAVETGLGDSHRPLSYAIAGGRNDARYFSKRAPLVQFLLENGADPNAVTAVSPGRGAYLTGAVQRASLEVVKLLLKHGAQIEQSGALHEAAQLGRIDAMDLLLQHGADVNEQLQEIDSGSKWRTKRRKEVGIQPENSTDHIVRARVKMETPLHFSVFFRQVEATSWLMEHGAIASIEDSHGWTAERIATKIGDSGVLEALESPRP